MAGKLRPKIVAPVLFKSQIHKVDSYSWGWQIKWPKSVFQPRPKYIKHRVSLASSAAWRVQGICSGMLVLLTIRCHTLLYRNCYTSNKSNNSQTAVGTE